MKKTINCELKIELDFDKVDFGIEDELYVFKQKIITPWDEVVTQGICQKKEIENFYKNKFIRKFDKLLLYKKAERYYSSRTNTEEHWDPINHIVKNPYDYIEKMGTKDISLYSFDGFDERFYDINDNLLPKGILISYMSHNGSMIKERYDLEKVLSKLKDSPKIRFMKESDKKILEVPNNYMSDYGKYYLNFIVIPTREEYITYLGEKENKFNYILDDVVDLKEFRLKK